MKVIRFKRNDNRWIYEVDGFTFFERETTDYLLRKGIKEESVKEMLYDFNTEGYNMAEFGIRGTLIFTSVTSSMVQ